MQTSLVRSRVPRHIRRLIRYGSPQCNYVREEYRTSGERNTRYSELRHKRVRHLIRYSDISAVGINVFVVAFVPDRLGNDETENNETDHR